MLQSEEGCSTEIQKGTSSLGALSKRRVELEARARRITRAIADSGHSRSLLAELQSIDPKSSRRIASSTFALTSPQVGNAHAGQHTALQCLWRKCARTTQNRAGNPCLGKRLPQRHSLTPVDHARLRQHIFGPLETSQGDIGHIVLRIAIDEVEDSMASGVGSGHKRRPGNWSLCRVSCFKAGVAAGCLNLREIGKFTAPQHRFHNAGLKPVQSDDDNFSAQENGPETREFLLECPWELPGWLTWRPGGTFALL